MQWMTKRNKSDFYISVVAMRQRRMRAAWCGADGEAQCMTKEKMSVVVII